MADYAKKEDITGYAKKEELAGFTKKEDLAGYAKKDELPAPKSLAELGGVTQAGVEAIIQAKNFTSEEAVKQMIKEAIAAALKDIPSGGTSTPENKPTPKPYKETGNEEYEWIHYFVVPAGKWDISTDINSFFGETITCEDLIGPNDDMTDFKVEIRQLGTLRDNVNQKAAVDDDIQGRTFNIDYTKIWKDGIRCPIRDIVPAEVEEQFQAELDKMSSINMGAIDYDGETVMSTTRTTAGCGTLFMIRKLKNGTFSEYSMGEKIA